MPGQRSRFFRFTTHTERRRKAIRLSSEQHTVRKPTLSDYIYPARPSKRPITVSMLQNLTQRRDKVKGPDHYRVRSFAIYH